MYTMDMFKGVGKNLRHGSHRSSADGFGFLACGVKLYAQRWTAVRRTVLAM